MEFIRGFTVNDFTTKVFLGRLCDDSQRHAKTHTTHSLHAEEYSRYMSLCAYVCVQYTVYLCTIKLLQPSFLQLFTIVQTEHNKNIFRNFIELLSIHSNQLIHYSKHKIFRLFSLTWRTHKFLTFKSTVSFFLYNFNCACFLNSITWVHSASIIRSNDTNQIYSYQIVLEFILCHLMAVDQ